MIIAIDGPGGSGKSTVARAVAARLGISHLDTGAMYRVVAFIALSRAVNLDDEPALAGIAEGTKMVIAASVFADGIDVTDAIRAHPVNAVVSRVAAKPLVRAALVSRQREWVQSQPGAVVEGRDIGSVVLPDADVKIYLTASEAERARRRARQQGVEDDDEMLAATRESIAARDAVDASRAAAPLLIADGAIVIDSTDMATDEVVNVIVGLVLARTTR